jgi:pimeloyl-ACP methyl ester carboxylesterase
MNDTATDLSLTAPLPGETPAACLARIAGQGEVRRVSFGAGEMVWRIWGEGRPVIFLHGGYGTWMHWVRNVLPLSRHFRVIVADMPAHGDADGLPRSTTREGMAEALARGFDGVLPKDEPYDLVGFSMGANLSAAAIDAYGREPENLVVVGAGGLGVASEPVTGLKKWRPDLPVEELDARHRNNLGVIMFHDPSRVDDLAVHVQRENGLHMRFRVRRDGATTMLRDYLPRVKTRLAAVWGAHDVYTVGNRDQRIAVMRATHPDLRIAIVDDAAHWVMYERADAFNAVLVGLLQR